MPTGYSAASNAWVSEVRMGLGSGSRKHSAGSWNGRTMWEEMSVNIGSTKNPEGLVIADKGVNGKKQKFFEGSKPTAANDRNMKKTKLKHRSTAGVFSYMRNDDIWDIFTEASQGMVRVMHEFDESYKWGSENGEPKPPSRSGKQPTAGLRDLYCYWIDMELAKIEGTAGLWQTEAKAKFEAKYKARGSRDATNWLKMFSPGRPMGKDQLTFNRASNGHKKPSTNNPDIWKESNFAGLWRTGAGYGAAGPF